MDFSELGEVGEVAQVSIGELQEIMPEGTRVRGVMMVVEMAFDCDNCDDEHEMMYVHSNVDSTAYRRGLLYEALDSLDAGSVQRVVEEPHDDDD